MFNTEILIAIVAINKPSNIGFETAKKAFAIIAFEIPIVIIAEPIFIIMLFILSSTDNSGFANVSITDINALITVRMPLILAYIGAFPALNQLSLSLVNPVR